ncbi:TetR/AcrR family transcriptional regulator [Nonomuraea sp. NPDC049309]|uniref:TetR/AcrR family transcriptional regulator n=1 Tax=Nonomuraea sp. NPDC049309 TaxID=3364350 RepID=UPI00371D2D8A
MATSRASSTPSGDRRVRRTQAALARALLRLVEERDLSRIAVADVAELAGVSRSTFYDHYRDVHELAEAACTAMIDRLIESLPMPDVDAEDPLAEAAASLEAFFASLAEHAGLYRALLGPQGSARVADHIRRRTAAAIQARLHEECARAGAGAPEPAVRAGAGVSDPAAHASEPSVRGGAGASEPVARSGEPGDRGGSPDSHDVVAAFTAGALIGVASDWLQRGRPRTPSEMAALTWPLIAAVHPVPALQTPSRTPAMDDARP